MSSSTYSKAISICLGLFILAGCGDGTLKSSTHNATPDTQDDTSADSSTLPNRAYQTCIIADSSASDACAEAQVLDFGTVPENETVARSMRIDNLGDAAFIIENATIDDPNFEVLAVSYTVEGLPSATQVALPSVLAPGESLFFELRVQGRGSGHSLAFEADILAIQIDGGDSDSEALLIPIVGAYGSCAAGFLDCDADPATGCEIVSTQDPLHCGGCGIVCAPENAAPQCVDGVCGYEVCEPGWLDLNSDPSDGCEYACTRQSDFDLPDAAGIDANCDGIDGEIARAIFVATTGADTGAGTMQHPFQSITHALVVASQVSGIDHIYVAAGQYHAPLTLQDGISIFGGYDSSDNWSRSGSAPTDIVFTGSSGKKIAVRGQDIITSTTLGRLSISTDDVAEGNGNNIALYCDHCPGLIIQNSSLRAGNAGHGMHGADGSPAILSADDGNIGMKGGMGSGFPAGPGGAGGRSGCERPGGAGGMGAASGNYPGLPGSPGMFSTPGGSGGQPTGVDRPGNPGTHGLTGANGSNGSGGRGGNLINGYWSGADGEDGQDGQHGHGGGGGGGSAGYSLGSFNLNSSGNGGGGGGGGGCRGTKGYRGSAGGSSFGLFLLNSTGITLTNNDFYAGDGGIGGRGGNGGSGSSGGRGALGGDFNNFVQENSNGGRGGDGGRGGNGGHGGGGAGGNSVGVYLENTDPSAALPGSNTITVGQPGAGGNSSGNPGHTGLAVEF